MKYICVWQILCSISSCIYLVSSSITKAKGFCYKLFPRCSPTIFENSLLSLTLSFIYNSMIDVLLTMSMHLPVKLIKIHHTMCRGYLISYLNPLKSYYAYVIRVVFQWCWCDVSVLSLEICWHRFWYVADSEGTCCNYWTLCARFEGLEAKNLQWLEWRSILDDLFYFVASKVGWEWCIPSIYSKSKILSFILHVISFYLCFWWLCSLCDFNTSRLFCINVRGHFVRLVSVRFGLLSQYTPSVPN